MFVVEGRKEALVPPPPPLCVPQPAPSSLPIQQILDRMEQMGWFHQYRVLVVVFWSGGKSRIALNFLNPIFSHLER